MAVLLVLTSGCFKAPDPGPMPGEPTVADGGPTQPKLSLEVSPATLTVPLGATAPFRVLLSSTDGQPQDVTSTATISFEPEGVVTTTNGLLRAVAPGAVALVARASGLEARASITVPAAQLQSVQVIVNDPSVVKGALVGASALATLTDGTVVDTTPTASWSVEAFGDAPAIVATGVPGQFHARGPGEARLKATVGAVSGVATIVVREARVSSLLVMPGSSSLPVRGTLQLSALARFEDGSEADVTRSATWASGAPTITIDAAGLATGSSPGAASVTASFEGQSASAQLVVTEAGVRQLVFMPGSLTLGVRTSGTLRLVATLTDGSSAEVTAQALFSTADARVASVSSSGVRGVVSAHGAGTTEVLGTYGGQTTRAAVVVTAAAIQSIELTPNTVTLSGAGSVSLRARALYSDGSQADVTEQAQWTSAEPSIAAVSNVAGGRGVVRAVGGGSTSVSAQVGALRGRADVTVQAPTVRSLEVMPGAVTLEAGQDRLLRAVANFSDGTIRDVTAQAAWLSAQPMIAIVSDSGATKGKVEAKQTGTAIISASYRGQSATSTVSVQMATITRIAVSPSALTLPVGLPAGIEATAVLSDGTTYPASESVTWTSSNPMVAEVLTSQGYAYIEARSPGVVTITATWPEPGVTPGRATLTISSATLSRIEVSPPQPSLPVGAYLELSATGIYSDFTTQYLRYAASWTSSDPTVAVVGTGSRDRGFVSALRPGTTTITATFSGISATTVLTVTAATLRELQVTPFAPRLPVGFDTQLRATGVYSDNTTRDLTWYVSWTSDLPEIGSIDAYATLRLGRPGTATITATLGAIRGTTTVTVTAATLTAITLGNPSTMPLGVQETRRLSAQGTFSDGTMMDVTSFVTWLSSAPTVASVSNAWPSNGEVKGLSTGSATITAIRGTVSAMGALQVQ